jgi:hypothetical protein
MSKQITPKSAFVRMGTSGINVCLPDFSFGATQENNPVRVCFYPSEMLRCNVSRRNHQFGLKACQGLAKNLGLSECEILEIPSSPRSHTKAANVVAHLPQKTVANKGLFCYGFAPFERGFLLWFLVPN